MATDDPDRSHDTDPLADTEGAGPESAAGGRNDSSSAGSTTKIAMQRRAVHVGDTLGRYELLEEVGEGGMATVYRARDKELRREVAAKVLFPHLARRDEIVRRFHREARAAAALEHPNILRVYDVGGGEEPEMERGGFTPPRGIDPPYIVMELVRGHSLLGEIERRGPLLAEVVACLGALLADALAVAHKAGIIHRDIKPANVMIDSKGRVLLADFGVARLETEDSLVTKTGALLGTPAYMSPEQASGDTATAKSDVYSLGATLYQLATGQLPYGGSPAKVMAQIATGPPQPAVRKRAVVGTELSRVIERMMASEPSARPHSAAEVASELRAIVSGSGFGEPADELVAYFGDPEGFVKTKSPAIVTALVAAARKAIAEEKMPRAMAIVDRASALAPDHPAVAEVLHAITEGGRTSRRRRVVAVASLGVLLAGAGTLGAMQVLGAGSSAARDGALALGSATGSMTGATSDAPLVDPAANGATGALLADAATTAIVDRQDAGMLAMELDAGVSLRMRDAGIASVSRRVDAGVARTRADAAVARIVSIDAAIAVASTFRDAGVVTETAILVKSDAWCEVIVDNIPHGQTATGNKKKVTVEPGRHTVVCEQKGTGNAWSKHVVAEAGKTTSVEGSLLAMIELRLEVEATIDGTPHKRGEIVRVKAGRHEIVVGGTPVRRDLRASCTVRSTPDVGCYQ